MWTWAIHGVFLPPLSFLSPGRDIWHILGADTEQKFSKTAYCCRVEPVTQKVYPVPGKFVLFMLLRFCVLPESETSCLTDTSETFSDNISLSMIPVPCLSSFQVFQLNIMCVRPPHSSSCLFSYFPDFYLLSDSG